MIFRKIEQDHCFIIEQNLNRVHFTARKAAVMWHFARLLTNHRNLRISQDICQVQMMDNNRVMTIYSTTQKQANHRTRFKRRANAF